MVLEVQKIYVRFVDGGLVGIPVNAAALPGGLFQVLQDPEFDYDDFSLLFEFGPQDIVTITMPPSSESSTIPVASGLKESGQSINLRKRMLFTIFVSQPDPKDLLAGVSPLEIEGLIREIEG